MANWLIYLALISAARRLGPVGKALQAQARHSSGAARMRAAAIAAAGLVLPWRGRW
jgi:hypothetical protein